jgi:predicted MPP superfamily phosphohydrolase
MIAAEVLVALLALLGHATIWIGLNNRLHAAPLKRSHIKAISALAHFGMLAVPIALGWWLLRDGLRPGGGYSAVLRHPGLLFYILLCVGIALVHIPRWLYVRWAVLRRAMPYGRCLKELDIARQLGCWPVRGMQFTLGRLFPQNESMRVAFTEKETPLPRLPAALEGLRILHLSDLHFSGRVLPAFFHEVVREANALQPDLLLLTGDICDRPQCLPWIREILAPLYARHGKFFILGNHDRRLQDTRALRGEVIKSGFVDLGGRCEVLELRGERLLLAGNEVPWFGPRPQLDDSFNGPRLLLSHSPDQVAWARQNRFDLMLAGHTHGGQIKFPLIGPVVCPSWYGVRYACGLFRESPTVVHVSRGVSGLFPIRWNSQPEVSLLILRQAKA